MPASQPAEAPTLPMAELEQATPRRTLDNFAFGTNAEGRIDWADPQVAPMVVGIDLAPKREKATPEEDFATAFLNRQPLRALPIRLRGAEAIEGDWIVDAAPRFTRGEGRFYGYVGRFRRAIAEVDTRAQRGADRLRQLLHELRTPVNAMQGYAEVIQQQVFGPTPHEYRALAASIAGDSARILAGFDELDRLARLETGALDLEAGESDLCAIVRAQIGQFKTVLGPRVARFEARIADRPAPLPLAPNEAEMLGWRILATLAGATGAGETIGLELAPDGDQIVLRAQLPTKLAGAEDVFASDVRSGGSTLSSGIFGAGFSLRLARAEARAAGGDLVREEERLVLSLPLLTASGSLPQPCRCARSRGRLGFRKSPTPISCPARTCPAGDLYQGLRSPVAADRGYRRRVRLERPFRADGYGLDHVRAISGFQEFCEGLQVTPVYLVDWPIANDPLARDIIGDAVRAGKAEIGVQLHPWVNPPFSEEVSTHNSYAGNLPPTSKRPSIANCATRSKKASARCRAFIAQGATVSARRPRGC